MQVAICTDGIFPNAVGGMQRYVRSLVENLAREPDVELVVLHPHGTERQFPDAPQVREISIAPISSRGNYLLESYRFSGRVLDVLQAFPHHLIYSQGLAVWADAATVAERLIVNPHGLEPFQMSALRDHPAALLFRAAFRHVLARAARVVSLGGSLTRILAGITRDPTRVVTIPNAVTMPDYDIATRTYGNPLKLLFVGRFAANKGVDLLVAMMKQFHESGDGDSVSLDLIGTGPLLDSLRQTCNLPNVLFHGFVPDARLAAFYRSRDVLVLPTRYEGMPTVILEAMSYGMPAVVSDVGAVRDVVDDTTGSLVPPRSPVHFRRAVNGLLAMPIEERRALSCRAQARIREQFQWHIVVQRHLTMFRTLLA